MYVKTKIQTNGQKQEQWSGSLSSKKIKKMDSRRRERIGDSYWNPTAIPIPTYVFSTLSGYGAEYELHVELP